MLVNLSSMSTSVCRAQAPLLGAEVHRSRYAKNERERKGWGEGNGPRVHISAGTQDPGKRSNLNFCWNLKVWVISQFEILHHGINW